MQRSAISMRLQLRSAAMPRARNTTCAETRCTTTAAGQALDGGRRTTGSSNKEADVRDQQEERHCHPLSLSLSVCARAGGRGTTGSNNKEGGRCAGPAGGASRPPSLCVCVAMVCFSNSRATAMDVGAAARVFSRHTNGSSLASKFGLVSAQGIA